MARGERVVGRRRPRLRSRSSRSRRAEERHRPDAGRGEDERGAVVAQTPGHVCTHRRRGRGTALESRSGAVRARRAQRPLVHAGGGAVVRRVDLRAQPRPGACSSPCPRRVEIPSLARFRSGWWALDPGRVGGRRSCSVCARSPASPTASPTSRWWRCRRSPPLALGWAMRGGAAVVRGCRGASLRARVGRSPRARRGGRRGRARGRSRASRSASLLVAVSRRAPGQARDRRDGGRRHLAGRQRPAAGAEQRAQRGGSDRPPAAAAARRVRRRR